MSVHAIELVNRALVKLGASPIQSFDDISAGAKIAKTLYEPTLAGMLSGYAWRFASKQQVLSRLLARPVSDFNFAYQLPNDFIRALSAGESIKGRGLKYRIMDNRLHCDAGHVVLTYIYRPVEANFPPFFTDAFIAKLATEFCLPITESVSRMEVLGKIAERALINARHVDSMQDTPKVIEDYSLISIRQS